MQILCNFWCETQITEFWSMEGDQSHNPNNAAVVAAEGQPTPSNEYPAQGPSTEAAGDPKPP